MSTPGVTAVNPVSDLPLAPIAPKPNLRESVTESLRAAIIAGSLEEGTLYSAPALGAVFGVSATPVREAMMDLAREGLVETVKNKGFRVLGVSEEELDEITEIRLMIEAPTVGKLPGRIPESAFPRLRTLAAAIVTAAEEGDLTAYLVNDRTFHSELLSFYGNSQLEDLATRLRMRTRMYGLRTLSDNHQLSSSAKEHDELLDLIQAGDAAGAEALMRRHLGHTRGLWATGHQESGQNESSRSDTSRPPAP
ncbi:GntR family transcriptional regulator [Arthrobacter sp.]|uniref:GntR family transcriptional regulator n=1 Tax=Arthrobacter sp. TaxID=1667 RepID=UPI00258C0FE8|nr:GntR family transcriptional regulator [Arthrobacter sp.]